MMKLGISGLDDDRKLRRGREKDGCAQVSYDVNKGASTSTCCARNTLVAHLLLDARRTTINHEYIGSVTGKENLPLYVAR